MIRIQALFALFLTIVAKEIRAAGFNSRQSERARDDYKDKYSQEIPRIWDNKSMRKAGKYSESTEKSVGGWYGCEEYRVCYYRCKECRRCNKWECIDTKCDGLCDTVEEEAIGDDAEVVCTLPDPNDVVDYQYFYPNVLSGCTSKNCDNPTIMGPFSCTSSSTLFGNGLAQMVGCTADDPQVQFSGCEQTLMMKILENPTAMMYGLAILGVFSTLAFLARQVVPKAKYQTLLV